MEKAKPIKERRSTKKADAGVPTKISFRDSAHRQKSPQDLASLFPGIADLLANQGNEIPPDRPMKAWPKPDDEDDSK